MQSCCLQSGFGDLFPRAPLIPLALQMHAPHKDNVLDIYMEPLQPCCLQSVE